MDNGQREFAASKALLVLLFALPIQILPAQIELGYGALRFDGGAQSRRCLCAHPKRP